MRERLEPLSTWGELRILELIGSGRSGDVYRAFDPILNRQVALKLFAQTDHGFDDEAVVEQGRLAAKVRHPNVVTIFGALRIDGQTGVWMELVRGKTLEAELAAHGSFSADALSRVGADLSGALAAVHAAGLLHGDIKTTNVLREAGGRVVLGDFGVGRPLEESNSPYLAPEVVEGHPATPRSDIYSLGVVLFRLATDRFPIRARSQPSMPVGKVRTDLPEPLTAAIDRAVSLNPEDRFDTATEMAKALSRTPLESRSPLARRWVAAAIPILAVIAVIVVSTLLRSDSDAKGEAKTAKVEEQERPPQNEPRASERSPQSPSAVTTHAEVVPQSENAAEAPIGGSDRRAPLAVVHLTPELQEKFVFRGPAFGDVIPCTPRDRTSGVPAAVCNLRNGSTPMFRPSTTGGVAPTGPMLLSPDGRRMAYNWLHGGTTTLRVTDVDGRNERVLHAMNSGSMKIQRWMGDGTRLLVQATVDGVATDALVAVDGTFEVLRTRTPEDESADLSPDGRTLVLSRRVGSNTDLVAIDARTGAERWRMSVPSNEFHPKFTPDGRSVVFVSDRLGGHSLFKVDLNADGPVGPPLLLLEFGRRRVEPIAFGSDGSLFMSVTPGSRTAFAADLDLDSASVGTPFPIDVRAPEDTMGAAWSPDGRQVAYLRGRVSASHVAAPAQLVIRNVEGATAWEFTLKGTLLDHGNQVEWSPGGDRLAVLYLPPPEQGPDGKPRPRVPALDVITVATRKSERLRTGAMFDPKWDPSGRAIYVGTSTGILRLGVNGGAESKVYGDLDSDRLMHFDLLLGTGAMAMLVVPAQPPGRGSPPSPCRLRILRDGKAQPDLSLKRPGCLAVAWVDSTRVLVSMDRPELLLVDSASGGIKPTSLRMEALFDLMPRPDGRRLLFSAGHSRTDLHQVGGIQNR